MGGCVLRAASGKVRNQGVGARVVAYVLVQCVARSLGALGALGWAGWAGWGHTSRRNSDARSELGASSLCKNSMLAFFAASRTNAGGRRGSVVSIAKTPGSPFVD